MSKKIAVFLMLLLILNSVSCLALNQESYTSKSVILISADDGEILFEKDSKERVYPASVTKIMLLILFSEKLEQNEIMLTDEVKITSNASGMGGSQVFLEANETQTVENLLKAICIRSANDASVALAEYIAGSEEEFISQMNKKASKLGMNNTNFVNVTGLHDDNHYSCAYDIALMSKELLKYDYLTKYLTTRIDNIYVGKKSDIEQILVNTNKLIDNYDGVLGIKTGFTQKAMYNLSAAAERNDVKLIAVVMGCSNSKVRFEEAKKTLNHGFANYKNITFFKANQNIMSTEIKCANEDYFDLTTAEDVKILVNNDCSKEDYELEYSLEENLRAPINKDKVVGKITIFKNGKIQKEVNLYPMKNIEKSNFFKVFCKNLRKIIFN